MRATLIAVTGGIGTGKSVVSQLLRSMGYDVYDCDSRAKAIMDCDVAMQRRLCELIHPDAVVDGVVDRRLISKVVFADAEALHALNELVHGAVRRDLSLWHSARTAPLCFVETAILYQSGLDKMVDAVWVVDAPLELRVRRVMERNGMSRDDVLKRIEAQRYSPATTHRHVDIVVNDGRNALIPQIERLLVALESCEC